MSVDTKSVSNISTSTRPSKSSGTGTPSRCRIVGATSVICAPRSAAPLRIVGPSARKMPSSRWLPDLPVKNAMFSGRFGSTSSVQANRDDFRLGQVCERLLQTFEQPVLVERFLPGREFTVAVVGTATEAEVAGSLEILLRAKAEPGVYSYVNTHHPHAILSKKS